MAPTAAPELGRRGQMDHDVMAFEPRFPLVDVLQLPPYHPRAHLLQQRRRGGVLPRQGAHFVALGHETSDQALPHESRTPVTKIFVVCSSGSDHKRFNRAISAPTFAIREVRESAR